MGQPLPLPPIIEACAHCGDDCSGRAIKAGDQLFCCVGCQTVYTLLWENGMLDFYAIDDGAGRSRKDTKTGDYDWLELDELSERFIRYQEENCWHVELELPEIHCVSCVWLLERLPQLMPDIRTCTVNFARKKASIVFDTDRTSLREIAEMLHRIGYPPHFEQLSNDAAKAPGRSLVRKIGVAGFCFGNIMLLSFPEYFGLGADAGASRFGGAVGGILLILILPVVLYAGRKFLTAAYQGLRAGRATVDLPISIGIIALFSRSLYEILSATGPGYLDSLAGLIFFLLIGRWFQSHTYDRLNFERDYHDYFPIAAHREDKTGRPVSVACADLGAGDVVVVRPGGLIPTDGVLLASSLYGIDYSFVSGEADPQPAISGKHVFAGGRATGSALRVAVTKTTDQSYLLQLWLQGRDDPKTTDVSPPEWLLKIFTIAIILLSLGTFVYWYSHDVSMAYRAATAVLIIACPCALALAAPFAYGTLQRLQAGIGYYFRGPAVVERLAKNDTIVFDKTGTLTGGGANRAIMHTGSENAEEDAIFLSMTQQSDHPVSKDISSKLRAKGAQTIKTDTVEEHTGQGLRLEHEGRVFLVGSPEFCGHPGDAGGALAVVDGRIAFYVSHAGAILRDGVGEMLGCLAGDYTLWLLSGDQAPKVPVWQDYLNLDRVRFGQSPFDKRDKVNELQSAGHSVLMVGDGLNDAGALAAADVGLAVSEDEARFNPACDGIINADCIYRLPEVIKSARYLKGVLFFTYSLAFAYNIIGLSYAVTATLSPVIAAILMPLSSVTIVIVASLGAALVHRLGGSAAVSNSKVQQSID